MGSNGNGLGDGLLSLPAAMVGEKFPISLIDLGPAILNECKRLIASTHRFVSRIS